MPTFVADPFPDLLTVPIFSQFSQVSLKWNDKEVGKKGVSALYVYFWNDGQLPILESEIITPYRILLSDSVRILSLMVTNVSRNNLGLSADVESSTTDDSVRLKFSILEPGDGLRLQLIIDGPSSTKLSFEGSCLGSARVRELPPSRDYFITRAKRFEQGYMPFVVATTFALLASLFGFVVSYASKYVSARTGKYIATAFLSFAGLAFFTVLISGSLKFYQRWTATSVPNNIRKS